MCQHRFIGYNKCVTLVQDSDSGVGCLYVHMRGQGIHGKSPYLSLNFAMNLKTCLFFFLNTIRRKEENRL